MFPQPLLGPNAPFMALVWEKELICCADRNKKCVACFVLCNWLWCVCGVCPASDCYSTLVVLYELLTFFFFSVTAWTVSGISCSSGHAYLRWCLMLACFCMREWLCMFLFPFSGDLGQRGSNAANASAAIIKKRLCAFVHIAGQLCLCSVKSASPAPFFSLLLLLFIHPVIYFLEHSRVCGPGTSH